MQDWYKTDRQCRRGFSGAILESVSCNQAIRGAAKDNRWPIDYFGCGYTNGSRKKGVHLFATTCGGRTDPPEGVVTTIVPIDRAEYEFLYEQSWAKPLLECFARSRLHKGKTTPSGHRIPQKWTQLGEPCEFSYDLLENAAREAGWPMGEYTKRFPVSYYKPNLSEQ